MLARSTARQQELAIRMALGATTLRLIRQWLTESFLLTALGGATGLVVAWVTIPLLIRGLPPVRDLDTSILTLSLNPKPDMRLLAFSIGLCCVGALLAGFPLAIQSVRSDLHSTLRAARSTTNQPLRWVLVALQAGLCTLLLGGTGLLISTFRQLQAMDPGFDRDHVVTFSADPRMLAYTAQQMENLKSRLLGAVREMPEVESAAVSSVPVMRGTGIKTTIAPAGQKATRSDFLNTSLHAVTPEYFETMGMRLLEGRNFRPVEPKAKPEPNIVNSAFVRRFFPNADPIGQKFGAGMNQVVSGDNVVIGVVSDAKYRSLREPVPPTVYRLWSTEAWMALILHVRTRGRPESLIEPVRLALHAIDPRLPFYEVRTLAEEVEGSLWLERALAWLSALFSVVAAGLAAMAAYGTLAYAIAERKREIGIRVALGARTADVLALCSIRPMVFIGIGIAAGLVAFYAAVPVFGSLLYGISPTDPLIIAMTVAAMILVVSAATFSASLQALRIDPANLLRAE